MSGEALVASLRGVRAALFKACHPRRQRFRCPACGYVGPFRDKRSRRHAKCPRCGALERLRLQFAALAPLLDGFEPQRKAALHIAPEPTMRRWLAARFGSYCSADLHRSDVDCRFDVQAVPFSDASFDFIFASHVLEYPEDDRLAIAELRRVLRAGGIAVLSVPLMGERTEELAERHPTAHLMRKPGLDYFDRLREQFDAVEVVRSDAVDAAIQPFVLCSDGSAGMPIESAPGVFIDAVPICRA